MPFIANLTQAQLRAATKDQIIIAISGYLAGLTKRQLILFLLDTDRIPDPPAIYYGPNREPNSQVDILRDAETGTRIGGRVINWTYYPTGEVDEITISTRDAADQETHSKTIKHFTDGRAPITTDTKAIL